MAYIELNKANWNQRAPIHAASDSYNLARLIADPQALSNVIDYDAPHLGDLSGLDVLHLQCHIGTDTVSLSRLGAKSITGLDFSSESLKVARKLAADCGIEATFVESDVYAAPSALAGGTFDVVYSSVGALNWLPDIKAWAQVVTALLKPGGRLYLRDAHPMLYSLEYTRDDQLLVVSLPYFEMTEPYIEDEPGTYTDGDTSELTATTTHEWNHGLGETVQAVIDAGLRISRLAEHTDLEWKPFEWVVETGSGRYALPEGRERLPMMYTIEATKS